MKFFGLLMNSNLKGFLLIKYFFLIYRVGYRAEKKSKIAHNFFVTKATDLKTIFLKSP